MRRWLSCMGVAACCVALGCGQNSGGNGAGRTPAGEDELVIPNPGVDEDEEDFSLEIPGAGVDVKTGESGTSVEAPGTDVEVGPDGTSVRAPGVDVDVDTDEE